MSSLLLLRRLLLSFPALFILLSSDHLIVQSENQVLIVVYLWMTLNRDGCHGLMESHVLCHLLRGVVRAAFLLPSLIARLCVGEIHPDVRVGTHEALVLCTISTETDLVLRDLAMQSLTRSSTVPDVWYASENRGAHTDTSPAALDICIPTSHLATMDVDDFIRCGGPSRCTMVRGWFFKFVLVRADDVVVVPRRPVFKVGMVTKLVVPQFHPTVSLVYHVHDGRRLMTSGSSQIGEWVQHRSSLAILPFDLYVSNIYVDMGEVTSCTLRMRLLVDMQ